MSTGAAFLELKPPVNVECSICKNSSDEMTWVAHETDEKVQHVFHKKCLLDWVKQLWATQGKATCPLCRKDIDIKTLAAGADLHDLIRTKNEAGKECEKKLNGYLDIFSIFTAVFAGGILSSLDCVQFFSGYNIVGIATTSAIYFGSGIMGSKLMPDREVQSLAYLNSAFCGGLVAAIHLIDPLSIRAFPVAGFLYAGIAVGISRLYLPGKVRFLPTNDENFHIQASHSGQLVHLIGMAALFAWRYLQ